MNRKYLYFIASILLIGACSKQQASFPVERIAHAGGSLNGQRYTNSLEALTQNHNAGFRYLEIDLLFTSDGHIVCGYDWNNDAGHMDWKGIRPNLKTFIQRTQEELPFTRCTLDSLAEWLRENKNAILVTDFKEDNIKGLELIASSHPDLKPLIIPQIYQPDEFSVARQMGFNKIIWTLYRFSGSQNKIQNSIDKFSEPFAISISLDRALGGLPLFLFHKNIALYAHTINDTDTLIFLKSRGFSEIYSDDLTP